MRRNIDPMRFVC